MLQRAIGACTKAISKLKEIIRTLKKRIAYSASVKKAKKTRWAGRAYKDYTIKPDVEEIKVIDRQAGICACGGEIEFIDQYQSRSAVDIRVTLIVTDGKCFSHPYQ
jgi:hypothetical protein